MFVVVAEESLFLCLLSRFLDTLKSHRILGKVKRLPSA
jgi:hypothetical protein